MFLLFLLLFLFIPVRLLIFHSTVHIPPQHGPIFAKQSASPFHSPALPPVFVAEIKREKEKKTEEERSK